MNTRTKCTAFLAASAFALPTVGLTGCENLPGSEREQGAVIGGAGGALAGAAAAGDDDRLLGAVIGGVLGAGGGYVIGSQLDKDSDEAEQAAQEARDETFTAEEAREADDADINDDGFVTLNELTAFGRTSLSDEEIINRLEATDQVFDVNDQQREQLREAGLSDQVIDALNRVNRDLLRERASEMETRRPSEDQILTDQSDANLD